MMKAPRYEIPDANSDTIKKLDKIRIAESNYIDWQDSNLKYLYRLYK